MNIIIETIYFQSQADGPAASPARRLCGHPSMRVRTQPAVRPGRPNMRPLPCALLDLLRGHRHRQGRHQDAHTEDVRHRRL